MFAIKFYLLDCDELFSYTKQYYQPRSSYLNYFEELYIPPLREELHVEENIFLEDYVEVKKDNIKVCEEVHEDLIIEKDPKMKIVEEIIEDPIIEKDLEINMAETIKE